MQSWIFYGVFASILFGSYIISAKIATLEGGKNPIYVSLLMLIGIAIAFFTGVLYSILSGEFSFISLKNPREVFFGILAGFLWGLGMFLSLKALSLGADVAKLTPLYNTNTLVAVLLGIILLHELPSANDLVRVIIGALLIVIGAILVSF